MITVGIDPGVKGAMAFLYPDSTLFVYDIKEFYDEGGASRVSLNPKTFREFFVDVSSQSMDNMQVFCECPIFAGGGFTIRTPMSMFESFGVFRGVFDGLRVPFVGVRPVEWIKSFPELYHPKKKRDKSESVQKAEELFADSGVSFTYPIKRGKNKGQMALFDGRAEASLIAYYGAKLSGVMENKN